jgi:hypothetical protein
MYSDSDLNIFKSQSTSSPSPAPACENVIVQCKQTLFDNPIKLVTLLVTSICVVYLINLTVKYVIKDQHYKVRPKRKAILMAFASNILLMAVYIMGPSFSLGMDVVSVMLLSAVMLGMIAVVDGTKDMDLIEGTLFIAIQASFFYMFYHFSSKA